MISRLSLAARLGLGLGVLGLLVGSGVQPPTSVAAESATGTTTAADPDAGRLVVWNAARRGIDIRSRYLGQSSWEPTLYRKARGTVDNLTLSRDGASVAFGVSGRGLGRGQLVVAATNGNGVRDIMRGREGIVGVGVLGWRPDGRRLAFEGFVDERGSGSFRPAYLFTVNADGTRLRRHQQLDDGRNNGAVFGEIGWTRSGFVYPDDYRILLLRRDGRVERVLVHGSGVGGAHLSGDGRWLFYSRTGYPDPVRLYRIRPNGQDRQLVARGDDERWGELLGAVPDRTGERVLDFDGVRVVSFSVTAPRDVATVPIRGTTTVVDWR